MGAHSSPPTRGKGKLEGFLARKRAHRALHLLRSIDQRTAILDIGCGAWPQLLVDSGFGLRVGVDQAPAPAWARAREMGVHLLVHDAEEAAGLPFAGAAFDAVTMLAVIEHLHADRLDRLLPEVLRVLRPGGGLVLTTPAPQTDPLLRVMARVGLVSREEIDEHEHYYGPAAVGRLLQGAGFGPVRTGRFELGMNVWAVASRPR